MGLVVLLKGINVGGHRRFRPSVLARELGHYDVENIGAAGTFVIRAAIGRAKLRAEVERRLPFEAEVMICNGEDIVRLVCADPFAGRTAEPDIVQFVSVMARARPPRFPLPLALPTAEDWSLTVLGCQGRFVFGLHRRQMKAIRYLNQLETVLGVPVTTRSWSTIMKISEVLRGQ